jgi:hypothetical protein
MTHLAADALIEAIDGPTVVGSLEGKSMPILRGLPTLRVVTVVPDGETEMLSAPIRETAKLFATCGALLKA